MRRNKEKDHRINKEVKSDPVRIVGDDIESRICSLYEALKIANEKGKDLVEISPNANPAVCRIVDYKKFLYDQEKNKKRPEKVIVKEIRLTPNIDDHDLNFKTKHAINFLSKGNKLKLTMFFVGREIQFKDEGERVLLTLAQQLEEYGSVEKLPQLEGKRMIMYIKPKKK